MIDQMRLSQNISYPKTTENEQFDNLENQVQSTIVKSTMAVIQKYQQIHKVHRRADCTDKIGKCGWKSNFNEDERI